MKVNRSSSQEAQTYREVRGLSRGIEVLRALNALPGGTGTVIDLARATGIHRTTVKRLLETLKKNGLVHHRDDGARYSLTFVVRRLSEGYVGTDWVDQVAAPLMRQHLKRLLWPSDLATPDDGCMIVRESTHRTSLLSQHRAMIGARIPILSTAIGRAWLSWCADEERESTLALLRKREDGMGKLARDAKFVAQIIRDTRARGYAINRGEWEAQPTVVGIGLPILAEQRAISAINLILQRNAVTDEEIAARHVPLLQALADEISAGVTAAAAVHAIPKDRA